jgi:hypothetical protein
MIRRFMFGRTQEVVVAINILGRMPRPFSSLAVRSIIFAADRPATRSQTIWLSGD